MTTGAKSAQFAQHAIVGLALIAIAAIVGFFAIETEDCLRWPRPHEFAPTSAKAYGYWIARDYQNTTTAPDVVIFGDSQLGGLRSADAKIARRKLDFALDHRSYATETKLPNLQTFVVSQPGGLISDYLIVAESLFSNGHKPKAVVLTVTPRVFLNNGLSCPGASEYYKYFSSNVPLGALYDLVFPAFMNKLQAIAQSVFRQPLPKVAPGQFLFLPDDRQGFNDLDLYPKNFSFKPEDYKLQLQVFETALAYFKREEIETVVVSTPMLRTSSIEAFSKLHDSLSAEIAAVCARQNAVYFDLTNNKQFTKSDFLDPIHLSQDGGAKLAGVLAHCLSSTNVCAKNAAGPKRRKVSSNKPRASQL